jgi:hypothetical protein
MFLRVKSPADRRLLRRALLLIVSLPLLQALQSVRYVVRLRSPALITCLLRQALHQQAGITPAFCKTPHSVCAMLRVKSPPDHRRFRQDSLPTSPAHHYPAHANAQRVRYVLRLKCPRLITACCDVRSHNEPASSLRYCKCTQRVRYVLVKSPALIAACFAGSLPAGVESSALFWENTRSVTACQCVSNWCAVVLDVVQQSAQRWIIASGLSYLSGMQ